MFLRFIGVTNAGLWLGMAVFFTCAAEPLFFSSAVLKILPAGHAGAAAHLLLGRFYQWSYVCGSIALGHLLVEWLYAARPLRRGPFYLALSMLALVLLSGLWLQPKMEARHLQAFGARSTHEEREAGRRLYGALRGTIRFFNGLVCLGLVVYVWQVSSAGAPSRFTSAGKFRS